MASNSVCPASASRVLAGWKKERRHAAVLYYPMVNPPGPIVWQGLLYWDGIASIVPWDRDYFQPLLRELHDTPFYKALDADNLKLRGGPRYDAMLREPEAIVEEVPGENLEPGPGPLRAGYSHTS